jgi:hypothetical protein
MHEFEPWQSMLNTRKLPFGSDSLDQDFPPLVVRSKRFFSYPAATSTTQIFDEKQDAALMVDRPVWGMDCFAHNLPPSLEMNRATLLPPRPIAVQLSLVVHAKSEVPSGNVDTLVQFAPPFTLSMSVS